MIFISFIFIIIIIYIIIIIIFNRIEGVVSTLFWALFGHVDLTTFDTSENAEITQVTGHLLFATYSLASVLVALNLLIAMLSNTFKKVSVSDTVDSLLTDTSIRWTPPSNGHLESVPAVRILQSFSYKLNCP